MMAAHPLRAWGRGAAHWAARLLLAGTAGCASTRPGLDAHRLVPYRPDMTGIQIAAVVPVAAPAAATQAVVVASVPATTQAVVVASGVPAASNTVAVGTSGTPSVPAASNAVPAAPTAPVEVGRPLHRGIKVLIRLRGIPEPEEFTDQIDDLGEVTFTHIGPIKIMGLTTAEAEHLVEQTYIDRKIYRQINVIITTEEEEYFVQGEVRRPGKYTFTRKVTLLQTISEAGGFTPFANRKKIKVMKDQTKEFAIYDAKAIADGGEMDPLIEPGDVIDVPRGWY